MNAQGSYPLPEDPALAEVAGALRDTGHWGRVVDDRWHVGDEVNEAARIEACASGGRVLASKDLIERLESEDAAALYLDPGRITYTPLADLDTATEKARRDAPALAVCDV